MKYLIVGLGNIGPEYHETRHNIGFMAVDALAKAAGATFTDGRYGFTTTLSVKGRQLLLLKPSTFMNLSGQAVQEAAAFYKLPMEKVLVFVDDISLEPGHVRIRRKGTDGGHNGLKNIIYLTGSDQFPRVKIGVGAKPHPDYDLAKWVLSRFSAEERKALDSVLEQAADIAKLIVSGRMDEAMNGYNGK